MSYTPTNWASGDIITTEKLNKIEQGISEVSNINSGSSGIVQGPLIVSEASDGLVVVLNKTWQEIYNAVEAGRAIYLTWDNDEPETLPARMSLILISAEWDAGGEWPSPYVVRFCDPDDPDRFTYGAIQASDYPVHGTNSSGGHV